jgi:hypothetical protein
MEICPVVPLGPAGGKKNLIGPAAHRVGHRGAVGLQCGGGLFARGIERGGIFRIPPSWRETPPRPPRE